MTRKQMEQKIEELAAELAELKKTQPAACHHSHCCHGTCVHWYPIYTYGNTLPVQWSTTYSTGAATNAAAGNYYNYQIKSS